MKQDKKKHLIIGFLLVMPVANLIPMWLGYEGIESYAMMFMVSSLITAGWEIKNWIKKGTKAEAWDIIYGIAPTILVLVICLIFGINNLIELF